MPLAISPTEAQIQAALRAFCLNVLPAGVDVIEQQDNRVPEPHAANFVDLVPLRRMILATNVHEKLDCAFEASITGPTMTVGSVEVTSGVGILMGATVTGPGVAAGTAVVQQVSGTPGGTGTYTVSPSQTAPDGLYEAGQLQTVGQYECTIQLGFHSADNTSADMAQVVAQMIRDPYGVAYINGQNAAVTPLFASPPRQVPYINAEDQFEFRWIVECILQANITITGLPQLFVTSADITLVDVDAFPSGGIFTLDLSLLDGPDVLG
jgi:hypothetical protein